VLDLKVLNPFAEQPIKGLGTDSVKRHTPSLKETIKLLEFLEAKAVEAPESYVWPLVAIAALAGTRLSEAWGLMREDWDKEDQTLLIRPNTDRKDLKTTNSIRPIPVLEPLSRWLERYFACVDAKRVPKSANSASGSTVKALKRHGFAFGNQSLRHGLKQRLFEVDTPSNVYEELMGWSTQSMAANYGRNQATTAKRKFLAAVYQEFGVMPKTDGKVVAISNGATKAA
jgi:integrase